MPILSRKAFRAVQAMWKVFRDIPEFKRLGNIKAPIAIDDDLGGSSDYEGPFAVTEDPSLFGVVDIRGGYVIAGKDQTLVPDQSLTLDMAADSAEYVLYVYSESYYNSGWITNILSSTTRPTQDDIQIGGVDVAVQRHILAELIIEPNAEDPPVNYIAELRQWWQMGDLRIIDRLVL